MQSTILWPAASLDLLTGEVLPRVPGWSGWKFLSCRQMCCELCPSLLLKKAEAMQQKKQQNTLQEQKQKDQGDQFDFNLSTQLSHSFQFSFKYCSLLIVVVSSKLAVSASGSTSSKEAKISLTSIEKGS